jgi:hypothetical protein
MTMMGLRIRRSQIPSDHLKGVAAENQWGYIYMYLKRVCVCVLHAFPDWGSPASIDSLQSPILPGCTMTPDP